MTRETSPGAPNDLNGLNDLKGSEMGSSTPPMTRVNGLLAFLAEAERLKKIARRNYFPDLERSESAAEHSWHLALFLLFFQKDLPPDLDFLRVLKMALVHDLVEIYAGDTFAFDPEGAKTQPAREARALERLVAQLPADLGVELQELVHEFEENTSPEARVVQAFDRIQAIHQNLHADWLTYRKHGISLPQLLEKHGAAMTLNPLTAAIYERIFGQAGRKGYIP